MSSPHKEKMCDGSGRIKMRGTQDNGPLEKQPLGIQNNPGSFQRFTGYFYDERCPGCIACRPEKEKREDAGKERGEMLISLLIELGLYEQGGECGSDCGNGCVCQTIDRKLCEYDSRTRKEAEEKAWKAAVEAVQKKETWSYAGGGGYDTEHWCKRGVCFTIPGIKQIIIYGIKNDAWWIKYFFLWQVLKPEKYTTDGWNTARQQLINAAKEDGVEIGV